MTIETLAAPDREGVWAAGCKGWRWLPGMLVRSISHPKEEWRLTWAYLDQMGGAQDMATYPKTWGLDGCDGRGPMDQAEWAPDFRDPATLGCLLALVREAWSGVVWTEPCVETPGWAVEVPGRRFEAPTEAEALVAALEAAPFQELTTTMENENE